MAESVLLDLSARDVSEVSWEDLVRSMTDGEHASIEVLSCSDCGCS